MYLQKLISVKLNDNISRYSSKNPYYYYNDKFEEILSLFHIYVYLGSLATVLEHF